MKELKHYITEAAGISHLHDATADVFDRLMNEDVLVTIKVDSAALVVMNDGGTLRFFNRGAQKEIDLIHRAGMDVFEGVISHIESRDWKKLPSGVMFFLEYFNDRLKPLIQYSERPKNNMILLFAKKGAQILRADDPVIAKASTILDVAPPPIIHKGKLDSNQKSLLKKFVETDPDERKSRFGLDNFRDLVLGMFGVKSNNMWLVKDGLEGLVFLFGKDKNPTQFKVVDPNFTARIKEKGEDKMKILEEYRRELNILLWRHIDDKMVASAMKRVTSEGHRGFIEFVSALSMAVADKIPDQNLLQYQVAVSQSRMFSFTPGVTPAKIIERAKSKFYFEDMFRQLLFTLREPKSRANPKTGITGDVKDRVNRIIEKLKEQGLL